LFEVVLYCEPVDLRGIIVQNVNDNVPVGTYVHNGPRAIMICAVVVPSLGDNDGEMGIAWGTGRTRSANCRTGEPIEQVY
jgi:hypothetical protein